jgi:hypothetical protein
LDFSVNKQNGSAKVFGRVGEMETVWGAALAVLFVLATALSSGHVDSSSSKDKSEQKDKSEEKDKSEGKDKSEKTDKGSSKDKSGHGDKSSSAKGAKKKDIPDVWQLRQ